MNKIAIIGLQGSGKSTFANKLGKLLNRPVIHLDKEYFLPGWRQKYSKIEWVDFQKELIRRDNWIIDGNYKSTIDLRIEAADTIIFFDFPKWLCVYRVFRRSFGAQQAFDKPKGTKERVSLGLLKFIIAYPRQATRDKLKAYQDTKKIFIVKNSQETESLLNNF